MLPLNVSHCTAFWQLLLHRRLRRNVGMFMVQALSDQLWLMNFTIYLTLRRRSNKTLKLEWLLRKNCIIFVKTVLKLHFYNLPRRLAPSILIISPLSIPFSMIWHANPANSCGRPILQSKPLFKKRMEGVTKDWDLYVPFWKYGILQDLLFCLFIHHGGHVGFC